jgi:hypothetical protein
MYRGRLWGSPSALRRAATLTLRLLASTRVLGQALDRSSSLPTNSPGLSTRVNRISRARAPTLTGASPSSRSCCSGKSLKGPKLNALDGGPSAPLITVADLLSARIKGNMLVRENGPALGNRSGVSLGHSSGKSPFCLRNGRFSCCDSDGSFRHSGAPSIASEPGIHDRRGYGFRARRLAAPRNDAE